MKEKLVIAFFVFAALFILITGAIHDISAEERIEPVECSKAGPVVYEDEHENEKIDAAINWHYIEDVTITAYCSCEICCGEYALDRPGGIVYTASGAVAQAGQTIAVDTDVIPLGAWVEIDGNLYHAEDTGAFSGNHVDIYFDSHEAAWDFGTKRENIRWYFEGE